MLLQRSIWEKINELHLVLEELTFTLVVEIGNTNIGSEEESSREKRTLLLNSICSNISVSVERGNWVHPPVGLFCKVF